MTWYYTESENKDGGELNPLDYSQLPTLAHENTELYVKNPYGGAPIKYYKSTGGWLVSPGQTLLTIGDGNTVIKTVTSGTSVGINDILVSLGYAFPAQIIDADNYVTVNITSDYIFADSSVQAKNVNGITGALNKYTDNYASVGASTGCTLRIYQVSLVTVVG